VAVANRNGNTVTILIGNGDGTFRDQVSVATGTAPDAIVVGDFNGDNIPDLAICDQIDDDVSILLGRGDGTFLPRSTYLMGFPTGSLAVGDFNGDGIMDLANTDLGELNVQLGHQTASFSFSGVSSLGSGTHWVLAQYPGDNLRSPSESQTVPLTASLGTAVVSLASAPSPAALGAIVTLSATITGEEDLSPTGSVSFKVGNTILGTAAVIGNTATITVNNLPIGVHYITAVYSGDENYGPTTSLPLALTVVKATASISLTSSMNPSTYGSSVVMKATLSKGATGTITFLDGENSLGSSGVNLNGIATIVVSLLSAGHHVITAVYSGDANFN
jgi:hypothetical protein